MSSSSPNQTRLIAVYGSAGTLPGTDEWQTAYDVGRALAGAGWGILSGGYSGAMEAASQGAAEAGGQTVGVRVSLFEERGLRPNPWIQETVEFPTLHERLLYLVEQPDAFVALRGGVGTLSEITLAWSLLQVGQIPARPFVLVGPLWRHVIEILADESPVSAREIQRITLVDSAAEVVPALQAWWENPPDVPLRLGDSAGGNTHSHG
ncbi:MAG: LOG family protein [Anaerolineae bacterium]|nr:LOG family protein [Anaerolineae bacterium]